MNVFACESPKKIKNPYTGDWLYVPCGKCSLCLSKKAAKWTDRLEYERSCHPYCLFGTLTYSDTFIPKVVCTEDGLLDSRTGEFFDFSDLIHYLDADSLNFIRNRGSLFVGDVRDCQLFIKRLREKVRCGSQRGLPDSTDRPQDRYIRYFLVNEYGPTTFRPHYHFIIFTSSKWFAEHAKSIVSACWSTDNRHSDSQELGLVDVQNVQTSASAYVASYVNSFVGLPKIFEFSAFRAFKIFSKHPPLGTLLPNSKEVQELFHSGSTKMSVYRRKTNDFIETPIPKVLCDRLYPRVVGFDKFSYDVLSRLYCIDPVITEGSYKTFRELLGKRRSYFNDGVAEYIQWLFKNVTESESSLHRLFSCLRRVNLQANLFGVSVHTYFDKIYNFYKSKDYESLKDYYSYYEDYSKFNDIRPMLLFDRVHFDFIRKTISDVGLDNVCFEIVDELKNYGYDESICSTLDFLDSVSMDSDMNYVNAVSIAKKCINDSSKKKCKNEYLEHRTMDVSLKSFLINYHSK